MWQDPIVKETRELREEYAEKFNHDPDAIFEDILKRQSQTGKKLVSLPPRKPLFPPKAVMRNSGLPRIAPNG